MKRFAAKLLFGWHPDPVTGSRVARLFEERIVVFGARSGRTALTRAKRLGRRGELRYESGHRLRFVGLLQLMELGDECDAGEVWWDFRRLRMTLAQAKALLPAEKTLYAFTDGVASTVSRRAASSARRAASRLTNHFSRRPRRPRLSASRYAARDADRSNDYQ